MYQVNSTTPRDLGGNPVYDRVAWSPSSKPDYHVYVFNCSARTFENVGRINLRVPGIDDKDTALPGMKPNEKYHYVTSFPQPINYTKFSDQSSEIQLIPQDAIRFVVDLINPDNLSRSLDTHVPENARMSAGMDYSVRGVFFSLSNPPERIDVEKAIKRMETYYRSLLQKAQTLELTDKVGLQNELAANPDYAYAAEYFGKAVSWRKEEVRPETCEVCGEQKPFGRLFHVSSHGFVCVQPSTEAWKLVVNAGIKSYDQVPEDFAWRAKKVEAEPEPVGAAKTKAAK